MYGSSDEHGIEFYASAKTTLQKNKLPNLAKIGISSCLIKLNLAIYGQSKGRIVRKRGGDDQTVLQR